jgi:hypothetical protein
LLIIGLFSLLLAACSTTVGDEVSEEDPASGSVAEAAEEESLSPTEEGASSADVELEIDGPADPDTAGEAGDPEDSEDLTSEEGSSDQLLEEDGEPADGTTSENETASVEEDESETTGEPGPDGDILTVDDRSDLLLQVTAEWNTDFSRHNVPYSEIVPVLFRDSIRSLDDPTFETTKEAVEWLEDEAPVIVVDFDGDARAYPLRILTTHEIVNDEFGDMPVVITYCPLCNSALVFDSRFDGKDLDFGTTGLLRNSDLIMYDRTSETLWQQFTGEGIVGEYTGERLTFLPSSIVSFSDFRMGFPDGKVLSIDTGFPTDYTSNSYEAYDQIGQDPFLFLDFDGEVQDKEIDRRLPAMERVVSISLEDLDIAYPVSILSEVGVINDTKGNLDLAIFHTFGTSSAFYNPFAQRFDDVGATGVFSPILKGQMLTFSKEGDDIVDDQTGTVWNILGQGIEGPLAGEQLETIVHGDHFWFSWAAFKPDTLLYEG